MDQVIQLWGYLILTFLAVVVPLIAILLSIFSEGVIKLTSKYENEMSQREKNIKEIALAQKTDVIEIQKSLDKLRALQEEAESKLSKLNPKKQIIKLFLLLFISFIGVEVSILAKQTVYVQYGALLISLASFGYVLVLLSGLVDIMVEVRSAIYDDKKETDMRNEEMDSKTIELLSALVRENPQYFLKNVYLQINEKKIQDEKTQFTMSINYKQDLNLVFRNRENRMVKNAEVGFTFPPDFIIEKTSHYSIFTGEKDQVIRYKSDFVHANTNLHLHSLIITPVKSGEYVILTFIKAENIETIYGNFKIVVE